MCQEMRVGPPTSASSGIYTILGIFHRLGAISSIHMVSKNLVSEYRSILKGKTSYRIFSARKSILSRSTNE